MVKQENDGCCNLADEPKVTGGAMTKTNLWFFPGSSWFHPKIREKFTKTSA
jgi:hypothetical protein